MRSSLFIAPPLLALLSAGCAAHQLRVNEEGVVRQQQGVEILSPKLAIRECEVTRGETPNGTHGEGGKGTQGETPKPSCQYARFQAVVEAAEEDFHEREGDCGKGKFADLKYRLNFSFEVRKSDGEGKWRPLGLFPGRDPRLGPPSAVVAAVAKAGIVGSLGRDTGIDTQPASFTTKLDDFAKKAERNAAQALASEPISASTPGWTPTDVCVKEGDALVNMDLILVNENIRRGDKYQLSMAVKGKEGRAGKDELRALWNPWWIAGASIAVGFLGMATYLWLGASH